MSNNDIGNNYNIKNKTIFLTYSSDNSNNNFSNSHYSSEQLQNEFKFKKKKIFGQKIKLSEWDNKYDFFNNFSKNDSDIIEYINNKPKFDKDDLYNKFNINPSKEEMDLLYEILKKNPMINIRKRDRDYLLRIKIKKSKFTRKFQTLKQAQELRNILLLYSMSNDPKFKMHISKRNKISEANKKKTVDYSNNNSYSILLKEEDENNYN